MIASAVRCGGKADLAKQARLPRILAETLDGDAVLPVLAVHIRLVEMVPRYHGKRCRMHVEYGNKPNSLRSDTNSFSPVVPVPEDGGLVRRRTASVASSEVSSTCMFLLNGFVEPVIHLTLCKTGFQRLNLAKASIPLVDLIRGGEVELPLYLASKEKVGRVFIACDVNEAQQKNLARSLALVCADDQGDAFMISGYATTLAGDPIDENSDGGDTTDAFSQLQCLPPTPTVRVGQLIAGLSDE